MNRLFHSTYWGARPSRKKCSQVSSYLAVKQGVCSFIMSRSMPLLKLAAIKDVTTMLRKETRWSHGATSAKTCSHENVLKMLKRGGLHESGIKTKLQLCHA